MGKPGWRKNSSCGTMQVFGLLWETIKKKIGLWEGKYMGRFQQDGNLGCFVSLKKKSFPDCCGPTWFARPLLRIYVNYVNHELGPPKQQILFFKKIRKWSTLVSAPSFISNHQFLFQVEQYEPDYLIVWQISNIRITRNVINYKNEDLYFFKATLLRCNENDPLIIKVTHSLRCLFCWSGNYLLWCLRADHTKVQYDSIMT